MPGGALPLETVAAAGRIIFGAMLLARVATQVPARRVIWAHRADDRWLLPGLVALIAASVCFTIGLATGPASLVQWALLVWLFRRASLYGIEDVCVHALAFYFVFAGAGAAWSLDALLGMSVWGRLPGGGALPELALLAAAGLIFLSAGTTKLPSPLWRRGAALRAFLALPYQRRFETAWLLRQRRLLRAATWTALAMELALLPLLLVNAAPFGLAAGAAALGFAMLLALLFEFTWIGAAIALALAIGLAAIADGETAGLAERVAGEMAAVAGLIDLVAAVVLLTTLVASLWVALAPAPSRATGARAAWHPDRLARRIARLTWGFIPCSVFDERHLVGPILYQVLVLEPWDTHSAAASAPRHEVFRSTTDTGRPLLVTALHPAWLKTTRHKLADALLELQRARESGLPQPDDHDPSPSLIFLARLSEHFAARAMGHALGKGQALAVGQALAQGQALAECMSHRDLECMSHGDPSEHLASRATAAPGGAVTLVYRVAQVGLHGPLEWRDAVQVTVTHGRAGAPMLVDEQAMSGPSGRTGRSGRFAVAV